MGVSLFLLGAPRVENDGLTIAVSRRKALALLALLAADPRPHSRESLAALLWPEWDSSSARAALRRVLVTANKAVGPGALLAEQERLSLDPDGGLRVDVNHFREALQKSRAHRHAGLPTCDECLVWLREAAELYTGDFLAGFSLGDSPEFDDWVTFESESLRRDAAEALEKLAEIHAARQDFSTAIATARRWLALDPLHEPAHRLLIRLHAWAGDSASAQRQYNECVDLLQRELGLPPSPETTALAEAIHNSQFTVHNAQFSPSAPQTERLVHLPRQPDFVGRRAELAALTRLLADPSQRLVTVAGLGGMGKSALAIAAANQVADAFPDGAAFVPLTPVTEPSGIVYAIADAIGYAFPPDNRPPLEQLTGYLSNRRALLVLDNFEHLLEGAEIVSALVEGAPDVTFLVTSRDLLQVRAEMLFALDGMGAEDEEGLRLFAQSARRVRSGYAPQVEEKAAIGEICELVGGMPLAIVLAAGWIGLLTPDEIAIEIRRGLAVLSTELRDAPERQRSIRIVLEQTWARLNDAEQDALMRLAIFRGGFTRDAAQAVTGASLGVLLSLSNRQLLQRTPEGRFDIHELLRRFAQEHLQEAGLWEAAGAAHGGYFVALLERSEAELKGADQTGALERLRADHDNIRLAWAWALDHRRADGLVQAMDALGLFYFLEHRNSEAIETFHYSEGRLAETAPDSVALARLLVWSGRFYSPIGQRERAKLRYIRSLEILERLAMNGQDVRRDRAFALCELGYMSRDESVATARLLFEESVALCRAAKDPWQLAAALRGLAFLLLMEGDYREAEETAAEGLDIRQGMGDDWNRHIFLQILCWATLNQDQTDRALVFAQDNIRTGERLGIPDVVSHGRFQVGNVRTHMGDYDGARREFLAALTLAEQSEHRHHANSCRWALAEIYVHMGEYQTAYNLARLSVSKADEIGLRGHRGLALRPLGMVETVWAHPAEALHSLEEGVRIFQTSQNQRHLVHGQIFLSFSYYCAGAKERVARLLSAALRWTTEHSLSEFLTFALPLAALLHADVGQPERAVELHALAWRYPRIANSRWFYDVAGRELEAVAASLPPEVVAAAQERGRALDLFDTARELVEWLGVGEM